MFKISYLLCFIKSGHVTVFLVAGYGWAPPSHCSGTIAWVPSQGGYIPPGAVKAGMDKDGGDIYVGRAMHEGDLLPCKVCPTHQCAYVSYGGQELSKHQYEVGMIPMVSTIEQYLKD